MAGLIVFLSVLMNVWAQSPPALTLSGTPSNFTEDGGAVVVDAVLTVADPDGSTDTLNGASVLVVSGLVPAEDELDFTAQHGVTGSYSSSAGVLPLTGTATEYQDVLRSATDRIARRPNTSTNSLPTPASPEPPRKRPRKTETTMICKATWR